MASPPCVSDNAVLHQLRRRNFFRKVYIRTPSSPIQTIVETKDRHLQRNNEIFQCHVKWALMTTGPADDKKAWKITQKTKQNYPDDKKAWKITQMTKKHGKLPRQQKSMENNPDNKKAWKITQTTKKHGKFSLLSSVSMLSCHLGNFPCFFPR